MKRFIKYVCDYWKFKQSNFETIEELIDEANFVPPPITLTKLKKGEVIEKATYSMTEDFTDASMCNITIEVGDDPVDV